MSRVAGKWTRAAHASPVDATLRRLKYFDIGETFKYRITSKDLTLTRWDTQSSNTSKIKAPFVQRDTQLTAKCKQQSISLRE